jgi:F0F1-type ATP synthase assembly protein I
MAKNINSKEIIKAADSLSLGISMVVALVLGIGLGLGLSRYFEMPSLLWYGVFIGVAAAVMNVYKAYKEQVKSYDELKDDPRYKNYKPDDEDEDEY